MFLFLIRGKSAAVGGHIEAERFALPVFTTSLSKPVHFHMRIPFLKLKQSLDGTSNSYRGSLLRKNWARVGVGGVSPASKFKPMLELAKTLFDGHDTVGQCKRRFLVASLFLLGFLKYTFAELQIECIASPQQPQSHDLLLRREYVGNQ
jgi:hypothetical protein